MSKHVQKGTLHSLNHTAGRLGIWEMKKDVSTPGSPSTSGLLNSLSQGTFTWFASFLEQHVSGPLLCFPTTHLAFLSPYLTTWPKRVFPYNPLSSPVIIFLHKSEHDLVIVSLIDSCLLSASPPELSSIKSGTVSLISVHQCLKISSCSQKYPWENKWG